MTREFQEHVLQFTSKNLDVIPREIEGIKLLLGIEINILDHQGRLSITEDFI